MERHSPSPIKPVRLKQTAPPYKGMIALLPPLLLPRVPPKAPTLIEDLGVVTVCAALRPLGHDLFIAIEGIVDAT
uniref:Uncharacterized protein n=1 Tax=Magnetococcus massalia (strain MO-1) TaxID=451514 RepID=A0A1S7LG65_MAGMO|nr:protein of unknown function [Candidatus Magnetococcus massalia]